MKRAMPEQVRTFIAVLIPAEIRREIAVVQEGFVKVAPEVKWVAEDNYHVTMKFLGNVATDKLDGITDAIARAVEGIEEFDIEVNGAGAFPNPGRPRVVWIGVTSGHDQLAEIAKRIDKELEKLGFESEGRPFKSHITIGRVKDDRDGRALGPVMKETEVGRLGSVHVSYIALMKSELRREGPIYSVLSEIPLREAGGEKGING
jgi:2'-5' RNA ligase